MDQIVIRDLQVHYRVGVSGDERAQPQRLLISVEMSRDLSRAAASDDLRETIDYFAVTQQLLRFGEHRSWKLLEKLAGDIAGMILTGFGPDIASVEVKKFVIPETSYVAVRLTRKKMKP
jgi:7,8-dihydroneopterin aldolase/epimerase/oxygenase